MRLAALVFAAAALVAGPALACPDYEDCGRMDHHVHDGYRRHGDHDRYRDHHDRDRGHWRAAPCHEGCGEITLSDTFFLDGGVGPIPDTGFVGGGGGFAFADSFAGASAFASARAFAHASANVSIKFRGGFKGRHHGGHKGHKGGKRH